MIKTKSILFLIITTLLLVSCWNRSCNWELSGRYYCYNIKNSKSYIDLHKDGTFQHYFKIEDIELSHIGTWEKTEDGYCKIKLSEWNTYNRDGLDFIEMGNGILYINGDYLDMSPDGQSSSSFQKE